MSWTNKELLELSTRRGFPDRVWEPALDRDGDFIFPIKWVSRKATIEDHRRRLRGERQAWQTDEFRKMQAMYRSWILEPVE